MLVVAATVTAQDYPSRPIRMVVAVAPAGPTDILGRIIGQKLTEKWGQPVIIDNRPGGGNVIASELTVRANPDGYTLFVASATHAINPALLKKLPYDSIHDFSFITLLADSPLLCVATQSAGAM